MTSQASAEKIQEGEQSEVSLLWRFFREPLLHFLLLAAGLFVAQGMIGGDEREVIVVDAEAQRYLFSREEDLRLRSLTDDDKQSIVDAFVEEEILVREAKARGFTDSSRVRALLVQNMRFLIGSDIPEPAEDELRAHFEANLDAFTSPPSFDFNHVMFSDPDTVPDGILDALNQAEDPSALGGLDTQLGYRLRFLDQRRLVGLFGVESAKDLLAVTEVDRDWRGPYVSPAGSIHFLRVINRNRPRTPTYELAKDWISTHWLSAKSNELLDAAIDDMRQNYLVVVEPVEGGRND
ncbi:peptidylprolyl isomerase [Roseibium alexandrii]|uniref:Parvulin-like PPIase n=1 Tax=Roseibium alexandrii (strain DSM 17067 / NCIMB 14079 / DFL-11) TaxID=244592 RepID=A0A5E8GUN4_ROSAD|nr:peptidylprolyl isomerase [Roseibium alexandrii]EEE43562.1 hypothetical protein SADFL11_848 [Roseibium alexandrii DFL-11]